MRSETKSVLSADGRELKEGDRAFNYYDCKWGVIGELSRSTDGWFDFKHDDGTRAFLNGERISANKPSWMK
jgi:hypothetical protein